MDTEAASPSPSPTVAGPSTLWRLAERRSRKAGSGNIFGGVNLRQLQRLFTAAGDQDAEQRAQLVWGHEDEAELAQALIGLRARGRRRGIRAEGRETLGPRWLQAFNHLRWVGVMHVHTRISAGPLKVHMKRLTHACREACRNMSY
uniref:Arginine vasopressin-induced protein 1 n=1 Tax=Esox lucius TaxID=8010 RepID=A0A3P8Z3R4_ESOLU